MGGSEQTLHPSEPKKKEPRKFMKIRSNEARMLKPPAVAYSQNQKKKSVVENGCGHVVGKWKTEITFWAKYEVLRLRFPYFSDEHHIIDLYFINMFASFLALPARFKSSPSSVQTSTLLDVQFVTITTSRKPSLRSSPHVCIVSAIFCRPKAAGRSKVKAKG